MNETINYWPDSKCAKAFWSQHELPPYQELLRDTAAWLDPKPGQRWLDLGCGGGQLSKAVWQRGAGLLAEVLGVDVASVNAEAYDKLRAKLSPAPAPDVLHFVASDFSKGFPQWDSGRFDGVVSGLALQYAEEFSEQSRSWTQDAYDRILSEVHRLLKAGGTFVFSVNVPEPRWGKVAWQSLSGALRARNPLRYLKKAWRIYSYGNWLKRESRRGRFHYLTVEQIRHKLEAIGFVGVESRTSFAGQAFVFRCHKPAVTLAKSA